MRTGVYFLFVALIGAVVLLRRGATESSFVLVIVLSTLIAIPWYFGTRNRTAEPSKTEKVAAAAWLWFRRLVCLVGAAKFFAVSAAVVLMRNSPGMPGPWWLLAPMVASLGAFVAYVGFFGQGTDRYAWRDDVALHRHNKRRYKWWL
jgi:hypothetical protein